MKKIILLFCLIIPLISLAQKQNNQWYFGQSAGLDFNTGTPVPITTGAILAQEGSASIADKNTGALLFYTDGISVWNSNNAVMTNGTGLAGNLTSTQSALIVPMPGSDSLYYIFTNDGQAGFDGGDSSFDYSIVDMSLDGGLGDVTVKNSRLLTPTTEKVCATTACNGKDIWVAAHQWNSDAFYVYLLTNSGLSAPVISHSGIVHKDGGSGSNSPAIGDMKFSPDGRKLALGTGSQSTTMQVFDFDNATGIVSNPATDIYPAVASPKVDNVAYGISFSPDNSRLYVARPSVTSAIFQYDMLAGDTAAIIASRKTIASSDNEKWYGMQSGPDGIIYIVRFTKKNDSLAAITNPNAMGAACNLVDNYIYLAGNHSGLNLPNMSEFFFSVYPISLSYNGCTAQATLLFQDTILSGNVATHWDFGDTASGMLDTSSLQHASHLFLTGGNYTVTLIAANSCKADTFTKLISIDSIVSLEITPPSSSICAGLGSELTASAGTSYTWGPAAGLSVSTGSVVTAHPSTTTTYTVTATSTGGCTAQATNVLTVIPQPLASFIYTINGKQVSFNSDSSQSAVSYSWDFGDGTPLGSDSNPTHTFAVKDTFNVCLTVYNNSNCSYTLCKTVNLLNTGVSDAPKQASIQLYPNPAINQLTVSSLQSTVSSLQIVNVLGQTLIIKDNLPAAGQTDIDVSNLPAGVYMLEVKSIKGMAMEKFVKK